MDVTEEICCLGLFGPKSRKMIQKISKDDFSPESFKFGTCKSIDIDDIKVWAQRISYVGELGFELYVDKEYALKLYKVLINEGKNFDLSIRLLTVDLLIPSLIALFLNLTFQSLKSSAIKI